MAYCPSQDWDSHCQQTADPCEEIWFALDEKFPGPRSQDTDKIIEWVMQQAYEKGSEDARGEASAYITVLEENITQAGEILKVVSSQTLNIRGK